MFFSNFYRLNLKNIAAHFFITVWVLFFLVKTAVPESALGSGLRMLSLVLSLLCCLILLYRKTKNIFINYLFAFLLFFSLYGFYQIILGDPIIWAYFNAPVADVNYILWLWTAFLPMGAFFLLAREKILSESQMKFWFLFFFLMSFYLFYKENQSMLMAARLLGSSQEDFVNVSGYLFLSLLPAVVLLKKNRFVFGVLMSLCMLMIVLSVKRGAIVAGCLCLFVLGWKYLKESSGVGKIVVVCGAVLAIAVSVIFVGEFVDKNSFLYLRYRQTVDGNSSGRDKIYTNLINYYVDDATALEFLGGLGANGSLKVNYTFSHNDWIAILVEQGMFGFIVYVFFWVTFAYTIYKFPKQGVEKNALACFFLIGFIKSMLSMFYLPIAINMMCSSFFADAFIGYFLGVAECENEKYLVDLNRITIKE